MKWIIGLLLSIIIINNTPAQTNGVWNVDGDSLNQYPYPTNNYPYFMVLPPGNYGKTNYAVPGQTWYQRYTDQNQPCCYQANITTNAPHSVLSLWCGHNDLKNGSNATQTWNSMMNYITNALNYGPNVRIIIHTVPKGSDISGANETSRQDYNSMLRTNHPWAYTLSDVDANVQFDYTVHPENFEGDQIHLSTAGNYQMTNQDMVFTWNALTNGNVLPASSYPLFFRTP